MSAPLTIANTGNADLDVSEIRLPSAAMWLSRGAPIRVSPGTTVRDTVFLAPVQESAIAGDIAIVSNDPLTPQLDIAVVTDIRRLTGETQPLLEGDIAPLGEALTIQVIPDEGVRVERGALHYRRGVGGGGFTAIEMAPSGRSFIGIVPGQDVTEAGLEYFVELENSGVFATDPPDTADGRFFAVAVSVPTMITTQPVPTSGADYLAGREIAILVALAQGAVYEQGTLHFRRGGGTEYASVPILNTEPLPTATIPDSMIGPRGVEYWAQVQTGSAELTDPPTDPAGRPHTIRVRVPDLAEPVPHAGYRYRMASVPLDFGDDFTGTLEALLSDQVAFGPYPAEPYDLGEWRCFRGFPPDGAPRELPTGPADDFRVEPGRGFWLISRRDHVIATSPLAGTSTPTAGAFDITLAPGWNMIGHPFAFPVVWDSVLVGGQPASSAEVEGPWFFDGTTYVEVTSLLEPFAGYWVRNNAAPARDLILSVPPVSPGDAAAVKSRADGPDGHVVWQLTVTAACGGVQDGSNRIGVCAGASDTWDVHDRREPPPAPQRSLSLAFPHDAWAQQAGRYTVDYRTGTAVAGGGHAWWFDVAKNFRDEESGNTAVLEFAGLRGVPAKLGVSLLDRELGRVQDLRESARYSFQLGTQEPVTTAAEARFVVLVGDAAYVDGQLDELNTPPLLTTLHQNYPNPFNPETVIRWEVAQAGRVDLTIYDLAGALVKRVGAGVLPPGGYEFVWRGEDEQGRRVASGVYVYRLRAGDTIQTKRMTLVK